MQSGTNTSITIETHSPEQTQALGQRLGQAAMPNHLFLLAGELGAGKTCLTQGIARGLGIDSHVRSPTFVLATEHRGRLMLYHIDLYRLDQLHEVQDLGLDEYIEGGGVCVVEWADKAMPVFPAEHLMIEMEHTGDESRSLTFTAHGNRYTELLRAFSKSIGTAGIGTLHGRV
ncbi:MAG: tRNA (adenosine(37)-N6)-threonylcarbamoyltransferase complex ATPase subunit type 1 TsaE [Chloroflexi bacterium]|nr:tRNA (adenosine(37)-N6)-threonylcarbamoyltransferase complex ATPase subunit type 1 TsaE [Chloroflexota bacterium]